MTKCLIGPAAAFSAVVWPAAIPAQDAPLNPSYSQRDIHQYASALFEILAVRRVADGRLKAAPAAERPLIQRQAQTAMTTILAKHGLDEASFNRITAEVQRRPALRRDVRQQVMREGVGF
ncbi:MULTISPECIES: DUF4168 domain-containing protein [unclassified Sphingomonas]|nr:MULTISPECIES: DUF4168 domain-containing protein [unclassified Sphingomonas]